MCVGDASERVTDLVKKGEKEGARDGVMPRVRVRERERVCVGV